MNGSENSSLNATSGAAGGTSLSPESADSKALEKWENKDRSTIRHGTACMCGAHNSAEWERGGRDWLLRHIADAHAEAIDWKGLIREALAMPTEQGAAFLSALVDADDEKETLRDA